MTPEGSAPATDPDDDGLQWPPPHSDSEILWLEPPADVQPPVQARSAGPSAATPTVGAPPIAAVMPAAVSVAHLAALNGSFEWHESIAIVLGVADAVIPDRARPPSTMPPFDAIVLEPAGQFRVLSGRTGKGSPLSELGILLARLLQDKPMPVKLRLFVTVLASDAAKTLTLEQFLAEVGGWERPGRQQKLAELYERARATPAPQPENRSEPEALEGLPVVTPPPQPNPVIEPAETPRLKARVPVRTVLLAAGVIVAFVSATALVAVILWRGAGNQLLVARPIPQAGIVLAMKHRRPSTRSHSSARLEQAGRPSIARSEAARPRSGESPRVADVPAVIPIPTVSRALAPASSSSPLPASTLSARPPTVPVEPLVPLLRPVDPEDATHVFRTGEAGVSDAELVRPRLPLRPRTDVPENALGVLEILVGTKGQVESVHLNSPANRYREKWWVFAAKDWRFTPATKDGHPVRFLKRILLTDLNPLEPPQ